MFNLILLIIKIILMPLSDTKKEIILKLSMQAKELSLCRRKLTMQSKRIRFLRIDRLFYSIISKISAKTKPYFTLIKPETVLRWSKKLIKSFWTYPQNKKRSGRPETPECIKQIVLRMKNENLLWRNKRISDELKKIYIHLDKNTVKKIIIQYRRKGMAANSLTWEQFITSHMESLYAMDFFTVDTILRARFYVFFIIHLQTRQIVQYRITEFPTKAFVMNQLRGFSEDHDGEKVYLIHDNEPAFKYIDYESLGIKSVRISIEAPNMNPFTEHFVGSIRREALDWFIIFTGFQLEKIVKKYIFYYNNYRFHQGINGVPCGYESQGKGKVISMPLVFGLHHHYYRKAS